ncbi:MAG: DNA gyrase subunit B, partial [Novosphingobium sp.]|nr:DNA gyrase subunit B [Novosphingobium sp.]
VDGAHIRTLLLTFFHRQMPEIIKEGHLFIAQPPLFKVSKGRSEVYLKDEAALDRYLVDAGLSGRVLETAGGARAEGELRALVDHAMRIRGLIGFVPRNYDTGVIEQMALSGALDPALDRATRLEALESTAGRLGMDDPEGRWSAEMADDGSAIFRRVWRGVEDVHLIEERFIGSAEARKLHRLASEFAEAYAQPARLVKVTAADETPEPEPAREEDEDETAETARPTPSGGAITRPTQLLDAVLAAGRKGLSIARYKGLGEMNAEQLWETTLDPDNRALLQVKVEDADVTDEIFTRLMGDVVEPRRDFIQENALNVANLDV